MDIIYSPDGDRKTEERLLQPLVHVLQLPQTAKISFAKLSRAINFWFKLPEQELQAVEAILKTMMVSNYIFEDLIHDTIMRKGMPTANSIYGVPATLNAYYCEVFIILEKIRRLKRPEVFKIFVEHGKEIVRGQAMEICWRDSGLCPTEEEYLKMAVRKIGNAILIAVKIMQTLGESDFDFTNLAKKLGIFLQLYEDYQNVKGQEGDAFGEGRFTFPVVYAIRNHPEHFQLAHLTKKRVIDSEMKSYCVGLLEKCGSLEYTRQMLTELMEEIMGEVWKLGENPYLVQILEFLSENINL